MCIRRFRRFPLFRLFRIFEFGRILVRLLALLARRTLGNLLFFVWDNSILTVFFHFLLTSLLHHLHKSSMIGPVLFFLFLFISRSLFSFFLNPPSEKGCYISSFILKHRSIIKKLQILQLMNYCFSIVLDLITNRVVLQV